ncbi:hypothetical protein Tco_0008589 [Tanacetum coccineum]
MFNKKPKSDTYSGEADVSKEISGPESLRAKRKYQPNDCLADPRQQPPFSCRQLGYKGATSRGVELNQTIIKIEAHLLGPTGPRKFASTLAPSVVRHPNLLEREESKIIVDSQLEWKGAQRVEVEETKALSEQFSNGCSEMSEMRDKAHSSGKSQRSLSRGKTSSHLRRSKRLENKSKSKTKNREGRTKSRIRRSGNKGKRSDSVREEDSKDTCEHLSTPYKRPKPTHFTTRITRFKYHRRAKLSRNIKVSEGSKDLEDHLGIFSAAAE